MPDTRNRPQVPVSHFNEKEHRRLLAECANKSIPVLRDFVPVLAFGGASTGITYSTQTGRALTLSGVFHHVWIEITLTNKGSATGNATITGILEANGSGLLVSSGDFTLENAAGNLSDLTADLSHDSSALSLFHSHGASIGGASAVDDEDFTNSSIMRIHTCYRIV